MNTTTVDFLPGRNENEPVKLLEKELRLITLAAFFAQGPIFLLFYNQLPIVVPLTGSWSCRNIWEIRADSSHKL